MREWSTTMHAVFAEIIGPDLLIVLGIVALLFGGSQLPKLARSLGSASHEFRRGAEEGQSSTADDVSTGDISEAPQTTRRAARRARREADRRGSVEEDAEHVGGPTQLAVQPER
jgi:sec-independent protein translocase protein TatA